MEILLKCHSLCDKYQMTLLGMKSGLRDENQTSNSQDLDESMNIIGYSRIAEEKDTWVLYYNRISCYTQRSFPCPEGRVSKPPRMSPIYSQIARCHALIRQKSEYRRTCMIKYQSRNNLWRKQWWMSLHSFQEQPELPKALLLNYIYS